MQLKHGTPINKEREQLNRLLDQIIKRILKVQNTVPREALYIETGLPDIETIAQQKRLAMSNRIQHTKNELIEETLKNQMKDGWEDITKKLMEKIKIDTQKMEGRKGQAKTHIKERTMENMRVKLSKESENKSKIAYLTQTNQEWKTGKRKEYMNKLNRNEVSTIFHARTRMLDVKNNFRNKYRDLVCRACGQGNETQEHILEECHKLHMNEVNKVTVEDIFNEDTDHLRQIARKIVRSMKQLEEISQNPSIAPNVNGNG